MKYQFFGSKNVRTSEELKSVGQRKKVRKIEDWALDPVASSALRVPLLSSARDNILPFGQVKQVKKANKKKVGIYSSSKDYCEKILNSLNLPGFDAFSFSNSALNSSFRIEQANLMDVWLIHMQDEDDNPWLDLVLELGSNRSSLFLCEDSLSAQCYKKIEAFMQQSRLAS